MKPLIRAIAVVALCVGAVAGGLAWVSSLDPAAKRTTSRLAPSIPGIPVSTPPGRRTASPATPAERPATFDVILEGFEDGGFSTAGRYMAPIKDARSLAELADAVRGRGRRGIAAVREKIDAATAPPSGTEQVVERLNAMKSLGMLHMYEGEFREASAWFRKALDLAKGSTLDPKVRTDLMALLGIVSLRLGEIENCLECVGPSSCLFPIESAAVHRKQDGSREAARWFTTYLEEKPRDLRVIWLLNLAAMTLGEYPDGVPKADRIPLGPFHSTVDLGRFENVASEAGLGARGPNMAGGSIFDDFTGDGHPDLFTTSLDADRGASLLVNRGDGTFEDRSQKAGLDGQVYALNVRAADYDNDGDLDVLLLRGAWEWPARASLLTNRGDGTFVDSTIEAGLAEPIQSEAAAWGDFDNDGRLDLYVCGEVLPAGGRPDDPKVKPDLRNRARLYRNLGDGKFADVAAEAGVANEGCSKGVAWGDYDADGRLDLYVNDYRARVPEVIASALGVKLAGASRPRLYRNLGPSGFRDVSVEVGLDRAMAVMGCNFGDVDNDGFLDLYLGTGDMAYSGLDRNLLFQNVAGTRFEDVTTSSGTGHLQKGHGVSFADPDGDGDLDLFVELGGAVPGDRGYNALFRNPGHGRRSLKVKLVGKATNRSAIGAKLQADLKGSDGTTRSVHRTIGNNSSFGGNTLVETIGLLDAREVVELKVTWPTGGTTQVFRGIAAGSVEIIEGSDQIKVLAPPGR